MKRIFLGAIVFLSALTSAAQSGNVGINTDGSAADASALLDVKSTSQGVLVPRMTASQRGMISTPATGLLVFQTDGASGFYFYNGTTWTNLGAKGDQGIQGEKGDKGDQGIQGAAGTNGQGVPTGGTTGQVLSKVDGTDYNTTWVTPSSGTTLPSQTGNNGKFLTTDGAGALSWGSASGSSVQLKVTATVAQTMAVGSSLTLPSVMTFNNSVTSPTLGTWTSNNKYTVGVGGAGYYLISVQTASDPTFAAPMIDINNSGESGTNLYGTGMYGSNFFQAPHKGRGQLQTVVYLNVGDSFQIRGTSGSTFAGAVLTTDGSTNLTVVKL